ncbi:MAG TPA: hypothetical protein VKV74_10980 [Bryobacteraceae bacterium]|nr:hypothetical protein [Bryobacteraceae bacterium]
MPGTLPPLVDKPRLDATLRLDAPLDAAWIERLCMVRGLCFTMLLPPYRPAAQSAPESVPLKHLIRVAEELAVASKLGQDALALLEPLHELAEDRRFMEGGKGLALFRARGFTAGCRVSGQPGEKAILALHPFIRPLLLEAFAPREVFALGISRKHVRLFRCAGGRCEEQELPPGVPKNFAEAFDFDQPDHDLQNRSASGASTGTGFVKFGTLSDREAAPEYLHHYFSRIDRGLRPLAKNTPVFLMGVAEDLAAFRKAAHHLNLLQAASEGSSEFRDAETVAGLAYAAVLASHRQRAESAFREFLEMPDRTRTLVGGSRILAAAEQGRLHRLFIAEEGEVHAMQTSHRQDLMQGEDVLNAMAVETIRRGGQVFVLPQATMGQAAPAAAILRY